MKPSLVYEIVLVILQVLTTVLTMSSASNVAKKNSTSNDQIYSNNQDYMATSLPSLNKLFNHSVSQMQKSKTWKCVKFPQCFDNLTEMSVQLKNVGIRITKSTLMIAMQLKKNEYMNIFPTSSISLMFFKLKYSQPTEKNPIKKNVYEKRGVYV
ncbi:hypothetical protein RFI_25738 [Reticulomyxa filosa]|uniref:Uncharacterized protein n=1 Tax=Reticulomyxa filosa TaxID=46433 RepID=X6MC93_RETFI|nr:hypothetical protein RFI_25738 [Reticulomyxa filosa]|eukprot:ETO11638.1 hypothetical protein RFI_25738 [Reticulomyxa filosa]